MTDVRALLAETISTGLEDQGYTQRGANGLVNLYDGDIDPVQIADVLLSLPGLAIITLPAPQPEPDGVFWKVGEETVFFDRRAEIQTTIVMPHSSLGEATAVGTKTPRLLAAALLAAAAAAERNTDNQREEQP